MPVTAVATNIPPITPEVEAQLKRYPVEDVVDGCTAAAHVAYACSDAAFIYPITPSSVMAEVYEVWASQNRLNIHGKVCAVTQLQSEAGAAGAVHGSLSVGALTTTFTASQGLLLMIPPMYKIAGELIPCVFHVSARAVAGQALSIFGDHSDVMAVRQCGWALLSSASVQEAQDLGLISHMTTLEASVPFVHFFDGFRTSHELQKIKLLDYKAIRDLIDFDHVAKFRRTALNPTHPHLKGAAQGPEVYFQNVEVANKYYQAVPDLVEKYMEIFGKATGRYYKLFEYYGSPDAEEVIVIMGAGGPVIEEVIDWLAAERGESKLGIVTVKLYRPWKINRFLEALPKTVRRICVLDRTKEPGALGEPLFLDVAASLHSSPAHREVLCVGGRFGLGSKDFSPAMVLAVVENLRSAEPRHGFTVGINDDITHTSLDFSKYHLDTVPAGTTQCMFWGMGSDGTVGANKNVIKILGQNTPLYVQGYFAYSAHKAGGLTISHLRFGPKPIKSQYLLQQANYVAVHRAAYVQKYDCLKTLKPHGIFVLNTNSVGEALEKELPGRVKGFIANNDIRLFTIDANKVAAENGMGRRINNVLMTSFFKLSGVLPFEQAIALFKKAIEKTYGKKGAHIVEANWKCVDAAVNATVEVSYDKQAWKDAAAALEKSEKNWSTTRAIQEPPTFVQGVMLALERMDGDSLPTSAFQEFAGGVIPPGTAGFEKRAIALNVPVVDMDKCTQCNQCSFVCPHAAIRPFLLDEDDEEKAPEGFVSKKAKGSASVAPFKYRIQVSPYDCTGCELCFIACPDDALTMVPLEKASPVEEKLWNYAISLKDRAEALEPSERVTLKGSQFYTPMMEFSGACAGCGETPYVKLMTQLFGERMIIANATGCSSIWGASYPANAYTVNQKGLGPAWGNSLFEDNAEYGYGMAVATSKRRAFLRDEIERALSDDNISSKMSVTLRSLLSDWLLNWTDSVLCQKVYEETKELLEQEAHVDPSISYIRNNSDLLPRISQWIVGGDGWAYDIGFGGLDHVLASGVDVNVLILDTEVYSNTGGQKSKSTTMGAVHKFASGGCLRNKKDFGAIAMEYGDVYVASVASSANMAQTVRAFVEAEAWHGTSVILAYSPCIEHQYIKPFNLQIEHCKLAVDSGYWPLYRYNPALIEKGENPFQLDCRKIKADIMDLMKKENRFGTLRRVNPKIAEELEAKLKKWAVERFHKYQIKAVGIQSLGQPTADAANTWNVLYGTETGNAEDVARRIGGMLKDREVAHVVSQMDEVSLEDVAATRNVIVVCSTAGQGELPGNAKGLHEAMDNCNDPHLLKEVRFAVVGLGDSNYVYFNQGAKLMDQAFVKLGAQRMMDSCWGDDQHEDKYETALADWLPNFWTEAKIPEPKNVPTTPSPNVFKLTPMSAPGQYKLVCHHQGVIVNLKGNTRMTPADYEVDVRHLEFDLLNTNVKYALGDSLAIFPQNDPNAVDAFCAEYGWNPDQWVKIEAVEKSNNGGAKYQAVFKHPMTVRQLFVECLDVFGKPSRSFYENFWRYCIKDEERLTAKSLLREGKQTLLQWSTQDTVHYANIFELFPSCKANITIENLIDLVPLIKPRYYSIASAQKAVGEKNLNLCVGIVEWKTSKGEHRFGTATGFLARSNAVPVPMCTSIKPTAFNLPPTEKHPIVIAAMGTGLAPFRAFIQHRAHVKASGKEIGPVTVFFGCRYSKKDYLYQSELETWQKTGVISDLHVAFSRDQKEKHYIQHDMVTFGEMLYKRMEIEDGYFYLCGSAKQVPIDVRRAMRTVLMQQGGLSEESAENQITQWQIKGKYNVEAWA
eukprot:Blabericola_migrator_1__12927@NODE_850_length_6270_cov_628_148960_g602_i0_p1_GENE_NODE_850_length_6270_cov_628_148960_g602_i0NODE_850_length_6270_cov_628_148960_g602_i0_p1_ORF_typecomplete_len1811_score379_58POR_N/PF01855_19/1_5e51FAD_binding_1/PF00667_20/3_6e03FAD_binding_1/PF00667_20/5_4e50POR/PF01558_18/1_9e41Flavodoxin_1/PF00258_25/2_2e30PFOR_II/PF17147_4/8_4e20NAD_binding_1/PF00175_21/3_6e17Fer4_16/PF13484_6/3_1e14TPP_enzyme_C/PF02775_21/6_9e13EKR/PF10371_9/4_9e12Fer4_21/PF14697_6/0_0011Fer